MKGNSLLMTQGCFLASHPKVLPYFVRSALIQHQAYSEDFGPELKSYVDMSLNKFAKEVKTGGLPNEFYSTEAAGLPMLDMTHKTHLIMGMFYNLRTMETVQASFGWVDAGRGDCSETYKHETLYTIPWLKQPIQPFRMKDSFPYKTSIEVLSEIKANLHSMQIEVPDDFPFQEYTGVLKGLVSIQNAVAG